MSRPILESPDTAKKPLVFSGENPEELDRVMPLVYDELRRQAHNFLRRERKDHTLQTTALINEAYIKLADHPAAWTSRQHFFAIAANVMRRILVDYARTRNRKKRGGNAENVPVDEAILQVANSPRVDLVALDEALKRLAEIDPQQSSVVEMRYFGGMKLSEISEILGVSESTVSREWNVAKAWLRSELLERTST